MNIFKLSLQTTAVLATCGAAHAANIATGATGIIGVHTTIDGTLGTPYERGDQGPGTQRLNDGTFGTTGDFSTVMDTWNGAPAASGTFGYIGMVNMTIPAGEAVTNLSANMITANDGGWFGPNATGPGPGGALTGAHLTVPTVQITSDGGTTWSIVGASSNDYLATMTGHNIGDSNANGTNPNYITVNFTLDIPQVGINGIRLIGPEGGGPAGGDAGGFIGAAEFEVNTSVIPEPSALALLGLAGLGLITRRRR